MLLKYILKEVGNLAEHTEVISEIREEAKRQGLSYDDLTDFDLDSRSLIRYEDINVGAIRSEIDEYKLESTVGLTYYASNTYALIEFYKASNLDEDVFKKWLAYTKNAEVIAQGNYSHGDAYGSDTLFDSLPVEEKYFDSQQDYSSISGGLSPQSFRVIDEKSPFASSTQWYNEKNKENFLKFFVSNHVGVALQKTLDTYTQIASERLQGSINSSDSIDYNSSEFKFDNHGATIELNTNTQELYDEIKGKEKYALNIEENSTYKSSELPIKKFIQRVYGAVQLSTSCIDMDSVIPTKGITYKFIFKAMHNKMIYVDSIQLLQALLMMNATGTETVKVYFDSETNKLVLRGKDNIVEQKITTGDRFSAATEVKKFTVPTFSIIEAQDISDITNTIGVEYVEFYEEGFTFKQKYDIINPQRRAVVDLTDEFKKEYSSIFATYDSQITISNSSQSKELKLEYAEGLMDSYIDSYTMLTKTDGVSHRIAKPRSSWLDSGYVYRIEEAYWKYNKQLTVNELLAYFIAKGNRKGYRLLCMKILGIDYWLFYDSIVDSLLEDEKLFVTDLHINEEQFEINISYLDEASFVSGNIYDRENLVNRENYAINMKKLHGEELGNTLVNKATETIGTAVTDRFIPKIKPKSTGNKEEDAALRLNIDIHCPIFYGAKLEQGGSGITFKMTSNTGSYNSDIPIKTKGGGNSRHTSGGILKMFYDWLKTNRTAILGGFEPTEIYEGYILPLQGKEYMYHYILPRFQDATGDAVGVQGLSKTKFTARDLEGVDEDTKKVFFDLGLIENESEVTKEEGKAVYKQFLLEMKERLWDIKREGRRLFNSFLRDELDNVSQQIIEKEWNKTYNNFAKPALQKQPIFITHNVLFGRKDKPTQFNLRDAQIEGIRHVSTRKNSGLLLHEVGFGKTSSAITQVNQLFETGEAKRALLLVPNSVYDKFGDEILGTDEAHGLFPNANVVWLDNAKESAIRKLKVFTEEEEQVLDKYSDFTKRFARIVSSLSKGRITLPQDEAYTDRSNYELFRDRFDGEIKKHIPLIDKVPVLKARFSEFNGIYNEILERAANELEIKDGVVNNSDSKQSEIDRAKSHFTKEIERLSSALEVNIYEQILTIGNTLIDDLGYYKEEVKKERTIFIAKHSAVRQLRPSSSAVHRALNFKYGMETPSDADLITSSAKGNWAEYYGSKAKYNSAYKIVSSHPISLSKLNIDAVVVDEIHNFNNIVGNVNSKGIAADRHTEHFRDNIDYTQFTRIHKGTRRSNAGSPASSVPTMINRSKAGNSSKFADVRMASSWKSADKNKLNLAAICFDIQNRSATSKNVLLLSATPFTDHPLQVISVLGMANYELLSNNGIHSSYDFFVNYVEEVYKYGIRHDETFGLFVEIDKYHNDKALSNLITNIANVKITDAEIEKTRPVKAVIPQNKSNKGGTSQTYNMGQYFDVLDDVSSKVTLTDVQKKMKGVITEYLEDDSDTRNIYEIFPVVFLKEEEGAKDIEIDDANLDILLKGLWKEAKADEDGAEMIVVQLEAMLFDEQYRDHPKVLRMIDNINTKILKIEKEKEEDSDDTAGTAVNQNALTKSKRVMAKAISCQSVQEALVISPYLVTVGYKGSLKCKWLPDLEEDPAKVFVENSPKLLFTVKAIQDTLNYQKEQLEKGEIEKIGGQVVYFNKFNFTYGGKRYNAFDLLSEYLVRFVDGISDEKFGDSNEYKDVGIIAGGIRDGNTTKSIGRQSKKREIIVKRGKTLLKNQFNNGELKVLLGSKAIKEGIDLQGNAHTMYICQSEFSPTVAMQLEGRVWRQGNPYDNVRIVYVLALNSIDSFIYDKLNKKVNNIKRMLEAGVYEMNTTQFTIDTRERLLELITDVDKLTQLELSEQKKIIQDKVNDSQRIVSLLGEIEEKYDVLMTKIEGYLPSIELMYNGYSEIREKNQIKEVRRELNKLRRPQINLVKAQIAEEFEKLTDKKKEKYTPKVEPDFELYVIEQEKLVEQGKRENIINDTYLEREFNALSDKDREKYIPKNKKKPNIKLYVEEQQQRVDDVMVTDQEVTDAFENSGWMNPIPELESKLDRDTPYSVLDQVTRTVDKAMKEVNRIEDSVRFVEREQQAELLSGDSIGVQLVNLWMRTPYAQDELVLTDSDGLYYEQGSVGQDTRRFSGRIASLILGGDSSISISKSFAALDENTEENTIILNGYQEYVRSYGKSEADIPQLQIDIMSVNKDENGKTVENYVYLLSNPDKFKAEIRERWIDIINRREENEDFELNAVVESFDKSNELIKLR